MNYSTAVAISKDNNYYYVLEQINENLKWDIKKYTREEIYSDNFEYKPQNGKSIDDILISNMESLFDIKLTFKYDEEPFDYYCKVLIDTECALLVLYTGLPLRIDKEDIEYEINYEQSNLEYIDEL